MKILVFAFCLFGLCYYSSAVDNELEVNLKSGGEVELICKPRITDKVIAQYKGQYTLDKNSPVSRDIFCKANFVLNNSGIVFSSWGEESVIGSSFAIKDDQTSLSCKASVEPRVSVIEEDQKYFISFEIKVANPLNTWVYTYRVNLQIKEINGKKVLTVTDANVPMMIYSAPSAGEGMEVTGMSDGAVYLCDLCCSAYKFSARSGNNYLYKGKSFELCDHNWNICKSHAFPQRIVNGQVILVKKGNEYGAFQFTKQHSNPEEGFFKWWYLKSGSTIIDPENKGILSGESKTSTKSSKSYYVDFGPFNVPWSIASTGKGWIYYSMSLEQIPDMRNVDGHTSFCVTDIFEINGINVTDPQWIYKTNRCF